MSRMTEWAAPLGVCYTGAATVLELELHCYKHHLVQCSVVSSISVTCGSIECYRRAGHLAV